MTAVSRVHLTQGLLITSASAKQPLVDVAVRECAALDPPWRVVVGDTNAMVPSML